VLIVFILKLQDYGVFRLSTASVEPLLQIVQEKETARKRFLEVTTQDGQYDWSDVCQRGLYRSAPTQKQIAIATFYRSLKGATSFDKALTIDLEQAKKKFIAAAIRKPEGISCWDEYLKMALDCGVSSKKSSLTPVTFGSDLEIAGTNELIENLAEDDARFYDETLLGTRSYTRATRNCYLQLNGELSDIIARTNQRVMTALEARTGCKIPFINVDYRILADSLDDLLQGRFELVVAEIHPDIVDFINDGLLFESNGTLPQGSVARLAENVVRTLPLGESVYEIVCPKGWNFNKLYRTELYTLSKLIKQRIGTSPRYVEFPTQEGVAFNYPPILGTEGRCVPPKLIVDVLNDRRTAISLLEEAVQGSDRVRVPRYVIIERSDLPQELRQLKSISKDKPSRGWKLIRWWQEFLSKKGLSEKPLYFIKSTDHSKKKTRAVTFYDVSGFQTLLANLSENERVLIEEVDRCRWSESYFSAGSVNEVKTLTVRKYEQ
jgi:hypothetical protein